MREILFRGQTRRKGEKVRMDGTPVESNWVYGGIFPNNDGGDFAIIYQQEPEIEKFPVYAETVCQYTGLTDKNGKKIFEGDIAKAPFICGGSRKSMIGTVEYKNGKFDFRHNEEEFGRQLLGYVNDIEVIGNIFDNPKPIDSVKDGRMTRDEEIKKISKHYGYEPQSRQCIEEMAELTQAINKLWRKRKELYTTAEEVRKARENVIEELADVQIMIWQMIQLLDAEDEVDDAISVKLDRQIARIEHE